METNTQQERAKSLEQQAREYLLQSDDPIFTQYLQQLLPRIQRQPEYTEQLQAELDKRNLFICSFSGCCIDR